MSFLAERPLVVSSPRPVASHREVGGREAARTQLVCHPTARLKVWRVVIHVCCFCFLSPSTLPAPNPPPHPNPTTPCVLAFVVSFQLMFSSTQNHSQKYLRKTLCRHSGLWHDPCYSFSVYTIWFYNNWFNSVVPLRHCPVGKYFMWFHLDWANAAI